MMKKLLHRFCRWVLDSELDALYCQGVKDGVNQYHYDRDSALYMVDEYETHDDYDERYDDCTCRDGEINPNCTGCF